MKEAWVYILYSSSLDIYYVGSTILLPGERLDRHVLKYYQGAWTARTDDWQLFWSLECSSKRQARKIEKHIKKMKSETYIQNLKRYSEIGLRLLERYF